MFVASIVVALSIAALSPSLVGKGARNATSSSVVLERVGDHVRFHPHLLEFAGHYHLAPKPCAPYRGNEKGRVERTIQYSRRILRGPTVPLRLHNRGFKALRARWSVTNGLEGSQNHRYHPGPGTTSAADAYEAVKKRGTR